MKLRFRENSLRLRVNQKEVDALAAGQVLREQVRFPGGETLSYLLEPAAEPLAAFAGGLMRIGAPPGKVRAWAAGSEIGLYFDFDSGLKIAIEKDLECLEGPEEEKDPHAFPRGGKTC